MQNKLLTKTDFESNVKGKPIAILQEIEEFSISYLEHQYYAVIVLDAMKNFLLTKQKDEEGLVDYTRRFKSSIDVLESHVEGKLQIVKTYMTDTNWDDFDAAKQKTCHESAYERLIALLYIRTGININMVQNSPVWQANLLLSKISTLRRLHMQ
jgi:urate oxidase